MILIQDRMVVATKLYDKTLECHLDWLEKRKGLPLLNEHRADVTRCFDTLMDYMLYSWSPEETDYRSVREIMTRKTLYLDKDTWMRDMMIRVAYPIVIAKVCIAVHKMPLSSVVSRTFDTFAERYKELILQP